MNHFAKKSKHAALIAKAQAFAHAAHDAINQVRKYTGAPYWTHTDAVAETIASVGGTPEMIAAAHLHDTLEDTKVTFAELVKEFGNEIALLVHELTDQYTSENFPTVRRDDRKSLEAERLGKVSNNAKTIKLADLINNTGDIVPHDAEFGRVYIREKMRMLPKLAGGNFSLYKRAMKQVDEARISLDIN